jgi:uncharacterized protein (TIGR03083 family)
LRQRRRLEATLTALGDDDWRCASRCDGWTVQDVVAHLVGVNAFWEASVRAGLAGKPTRMLTGFDPAATPPLMVAPMRALPSAELLAQFVSSNDGFLDAFTTLDDDDWSMPADAPPGHLPVRLVAQHALWDSWVHERDIVVALDRSPSVEVDEVGSGLRYAAALGPAFAIIAGVATDGVFSLATTAPDLDIVVEVGRSVRVHDGPRTDDAPCLCGPATELLEALSLRAPLPASAPPEWRRLLGGLATAFDSGVFDSGDGLP